MLCRMGRSLQEEQATPATCNPGVCRDVANHSRRTFRGIVVRVLKRSRRAAHASYYSLGHKSMLHDRPTMVDSDGGTNNLPNLKCRNYRVKWGEHLQLTSKDHRPWKTWTS
jgi:hypothetical protein